MDKIISLLDKMLERSYSVYSGCRVACVLEFDGDLVGGCNVENASYGLAICAERSAVCSAISKGFDMREAKSIYIKSNKTDFFTPCGACLQVLSEFVVADISVVVLNVENIVREYKFCDLMPIVFDKSKLGDEN